MTDLANLLGWCTLLNFGVLMFSTMLLVAFRKPITAIHCRMMEMEPKQVSAAYFSFLANYKILIIVFNLVPYLALRIMGV